MKKNYLLLCVVLFLGFAANAQRRQYPVTYWGVYGGTNFSGLTGDYRASVAGNSGKMRTRWQIGLYSNQYIQRNFSIYFSLDLVFKGGMTKGFEYPAGNKIPYKAKTNLTTLSLPLMFNYTPRPEWGIMIGPQADYIISASEPWYKSAQYMPEDYKENVKYKYKDFGLSGTVALQYMLYNGITFQARYSQSILTITQPEYGKTRSYSIMLYMGINFLSTTIRY